MKKAKKTPRKKGDDDYELAPDYDMTGAVRGKHAARFPVGAIAVVIDPDLTESFPTAEKVNSALRELLRLRRKGRTA